MAADWTQLPSDLLSLIAAHLDTHFDLLRFRSVCATWRLSLPPPPNSRLSILPNNGISETSWGFYLSKRSILSLSSPDSPSQSWLVKIEQDNPTLTRLVNPLSRSNFDLHSEPGFPRSLDLLPIRVTELGFEYILRYINYRPFASSISDAGNLYMEKVALFHDSRIGYVLLTIHVSGKLAIFKIGDKKWTIVDDFPSPYDDVALFKGRFYAVDSTGRAVVVSLDPLTSFSPVVELVAGPVFGGDKKTMVASGEELLLIDTYLTMGGAEGDVGMEEEVEFYEEFDTYISERTGRFKVFRLNWGEKKWDEVKDLGDRMLFLGDYCTFSAKASDFEGCKGNCIIFADHNFYSGLAEEGVGRDRGVGVFDLESGSIGSLANHSGYTRMFWPPPSWIPSATLEDGLNQLGI